MDEKLEQQIYAVDPVFFRENDLSCQQTCMCWGMECGDGWFEPLLKMARQVRVINERLAPLNRCIIAKQIKSKWANLRVYWDVECLDLLNANPLSQEEDEIVETCFQMMDSVVNNAELECENTCELCGAKGSFLEPLLTCGSWITHKCRKCAQEQQRKEGVVVHYWEGFEFLSPFEEGHVMYHDEKYGCFLGLYYSLLYREYKWMFQQMKSPKEIQSIAVDHNLAVADDSAVVSMKEALLAKYSNEDKRKLLLDTGDLKLAGMNRIHENFWGWCNCPDCKDKPHLNKYNNLLMEIREEFRKSGHD